jgi:AcrR family transcriptional regulator
VPHVPSEVRRQQFIDAAVTVVARDGVDGATTRRIAEEAGAPLAALHYCFQTKENLLWAVFEHLAELTRNKIELSATQGQSSDAIVSFLLSDAIEWVIDTPDANRAQLEIWFWAERNNAEFAVGMYDMFIDLWKGCLRQAKTPLPEDRLETVTRIMVAVFDGLCMQFVSHGDEAMVRREIETATAMLSAYLGRRSRRAA